MKQNNKLFSICEEIPSLSFDVEGKLKGGFVVLETSDEGLDDETNMSCFNNNSCTRNEYCEHNGVCYNNFKCNNSGINPGNRPTPHL